ncbi:hypothetical protein C2E23DRAFT_737101 [Lenzites betulinus]|nr:hypothetical protein C2E23DRAFT_737101 [Lenzites betulinus]
MDVYNVPMALDLTLGHTDGLLPSLAMARNRKHVHNARHHTFGPMPTATFIDTFFSLKDDKRGGLMTIKDAFNAVPRTADTPAAIYKPLAAALNKKSPRKSRCPGFEFDTSIERSVRPSRLGYTKPHICCFTAANAKIVRQADNRTRVELGYADLFIDVRHDPSLDFLVDPPAGADRETLTTHNFFRDHRAMDEDELYDQAERIFGLHIAFAAEIFARQNRTCLFTVSVFGPLARLYRWDREGCVVTEAFDFHENPGILLEFFWRYSQVLSAERGHDPTTTVGNREAEALFQEAIRAHVRAQLDVDGPELDKAVGTHYQPGHVTVVRVYHEPAPGSTVITTHSPLIISRPVVSPLYLEGRGTRGYWALDPQTGRVMFLKDTWRAFPADEMEGDILAHLNECNVRNIPRRDVHGMVPDDEDVFLRTGTTQQYTHTGFSEGSKWVCRIDGKRIRTIGRRHYRLVTDAAGYSLKTLRGSEELLHAAYDVFTAMRDALEKDARIHRDLSVGNIVLVKEPGRRIRRGYLIDWESSARIDSDGDAVRTGRAGTWEFMSIRLLTTSDEESKHRFEDDMEALFYVVLYCGLRYLSHDLSMLDFTIFFKEIFQYSVPGIGFTIGGGGKSSIAINRTFTKTTHFRSAGFQEWLNTIMDYCWPRGELKEKYKDMWTPVHVDTYWSEFLKTRELEHDDRVVHTLSTWDLRDPNSPSTTPEVLHTGDSHELRKHPVDDEDTGGPSEKKPRIDKDRQLTPTTRDRPIATPRRSGRIRNIELKFKGVPRSAVGAMSESDEASNSWLQASKRRSGTRSRK